MITGGPGNDILGGTNARDRMDGGSGSDYLFGFGGNDRLWGDYFDGNAAIDTDYLFAGNGSDDLIGGQGANELFAWSYHPQAPAGVGLIGTKVGQFFDANRNLKIDANRTTFGVFKADGITLEDTGLNRMLGSENLLRSDKLYGGTVLDFMYGNGGGGVEGDALINRAGKPMRDADQEVNSNDDWKASVRNNKNVWYIGGTSANDTFNVNFTTDLTQPLGGRHVVSRSSAGEFSLDIRGITDVNTEGIQTQPGVQTPRQQTSDTSDEYRDIEGTFIDRETGNRLTPAQRQDAVAALKESSVDFINRIFGSEPPTDAIIIDALAGNDVVNIGETVQATVWVDGGEGDDKVFNQPQRAFLPDLTEPIGQRNDALSNAFSIGTIDRSLIFTDLTFDRSSSLDTDFYSFVIDRPTTSLDLIQVLPTSGIALSLQVQLLTESGTLIREFTSSNRSLASATLNLDGLTAGTRYLLKITSGLNDASALASEYSLGFAFTQTVGPFIPQELTTRYRRPVNERRDILIGGPGNDILQGGSGEDWIFGGPKQ